jgi:hypothetical protein
MKAFPGGYAKERSTLLGSATGRGLRLGFGISRFASVFLLASACLANYNQPLDRPYTLRNAEPFLLEAEYHRMISGDIQRSHIFPRPCFSEVDSSRVCREGSLWHYLDEKRRGRVDLGFQGGYEYRYIHENIQAYYPGFSAMGHSGPMSFYVDARMYTEIHENPSHPSFDREFVERQSKAMSGSVAYSSYSRYRSNVSYDWAWGRITAGRDAAHWGPGIFHNLVFHQDAVPFNQLVFTTHLGPFSISSLYGPLMIHGDNLGRFQRDTSSRNLYAHRYEWRIGANWLLGISEQMILYNKNAPFAFAPIVPLFIAKGFEHELSNSGRIAGDLSYRLPGMGMVYSEFLIDDILSPTSLFNDYWGNQWAWMAGMHGLLPLGRYEGGFIGEYCRIEPWIYTSSRKNTRQGANAGHPLGNQMGPNSQAVTFKSYMRLRESWYVSAKLDFQWKGTDLGSSLNDDEPAGEPPRKVFLNGVDRPDILFTPFLSYRWKWITADTRVVVGARKESYFRLHFRI